MAEDEIIDSLEDAISKTDIVDFEPVEVNTGCKDSEDATDCSLDKIAMKLLRHNFILTALEFHTELIESGRELPRLRDYFSNPGNFEKNLETEDISPVLPRTSSIQTFDSLDFARYSDDGEKQVDERIAVLEFELRKAKETIKALRANLTVIAESEPNTPSDVMKVFSPEAMKPHEKRALNFLVNEYLMHSNYKLTSITFSDENDDQDFEDWDDVGLNIPKPPDILQLYRNYCHVHQKKDTSDKSTEICELYEPDADVHLPCHCELCVNLEVELAELKAQVTYLTKEKEQLLKLSKEKDELLKNLKNEIKIARVVEKRPSLTEVETVNNISSNENRRDSCTSINDVRSENQDFVIVNAFHSPDQNEADTSFVSFNNDSTSPLNITDSPSPALVSATSDNQQFSSRNVSEEFQKTLVSVCQLQKIMQSNRLVNEIAEITNSKETVVTMLSRCLPHIVPNILLAKREELIPLILCAITLHTDAKERDKLLNILFNLIKKPDEDQRCMILTGLVAIAQHLGSEKVEAELLPQCWEQITHKYAERRLLVAESCGVLAPYVPSEIRNSLLVSMLQQMLEEDKEELVRETVVRNLALLCSYIDDPDKFSKAVELLLLTFEDRSSSVKETSLNILLPSIAEWALELSRLESHLLPSIMKMLTEQVNKLNQKLMAANCTSSQNDERMPVLFVRATYLLLYFLMLSVLQSGPFVKNLEEICNSPTEFDVDRLPICSSMLEDMSIIIGDNRQLASLVKSYDKYTSAEWFKRWDKYDWVVNSFLPWLLEVLHLIQPQCQNIVHSMSEMVHTFCRLFGRKFTQEKIKPLFVPLFHVSLEDPENTTNVQAFSGSALPIYIAGILTSFLQEEDQKELLSVLQELIGIVSAANIPIHGLKSAFVELSCNKAYHELLLSVLWDGVVHTSTAVRVTAGRLFETLVGVVNESLLRTRVTPALVTLASDPEISVRIATVPAFGAIMEICSQKDLLEKVHLQFQTFLDDPVYWDQYLLHVEVIRTFSKLGPNADPKFRDDFILPRLAALAAQNNNATIESRKTDVALALLDAYVAVSCCFMNDQLIAEAFLPGLRCLKHDLQTVAPEHEDTVNSMIQEFESKLELTRAVDSRSNSISTPSPGSMEDMKNRVSKIFAATKPVGARGNIPNIFRKK